MRAPLLGLALAALGAPGAAGQQPAAAPATQSRACVLFVDHTGREGLFVKVATPTGESYQIFAGGGVYGHCENEPTTTMQADSMAWYPERNEAHFLQDVHFRDSTLTLQSDRLTYFVQQERLYAEGRVYTQNLRTRSDLRGPNLDYRRAHPGVRDTAELYATARPTIRFYSARDSARGDSAEPFVIVADRSRMRGNDQMWGGGRVTIDRSDVAARADSAWLDLAADRGELIGGPPVVDGKGEDHYRLTGTRIQVGLDRDHELKRVLAQGNADATGPEWHLTADTLDAAVDSGKVQRSKAWGRDHRPDALSGTYTVVADSLDILMPRQVMREVWGFGDGRATNRPDSTVTEDDWMVGDTLHAVFADPDSVVPDSAGRKKQELRNLASHGSARALYHVVNEQHRDQPPDVNYSRGERIAIAMRAGKVATVDVVGGVDGVYLEYAPPRPDTTRADTTGADSLRLRADSLRPPADTVRRAPADTTRTAPPPTAPADSTAGRARPVPLPVTPRRPVPPRSPA